MGTITPRTRSTKAEIEQLEQQIVDVLAEDSPQSVRHLFYRMVNPRLAVTIPKTELGYKKVQGRLVEMRKAGRLPYNAIVDMSRVGYGALQYLDPADFIRRVASIYRSTLWTDDLPYCEVWVESRSLAAALTGLCNELAVSLYPCGGFPSLSFVYEAAQQINGNGRDAVVFYAGDYDPSGLEIGRNLEEQLRTHLEVNMTFTRLALNEQQLIDYDLPSKPRAASERRRPEIRETVEGEALPAKVLRQIVRDAVEALLPAQRLHAVRVAEERERDALRMFDLDDWQQFKSSFVDADREAE